MAVVLITPEAQRQFDELPSVVRARMEEVFVRLESWPNVSGAKPLRGELAGHYRIRPGDYRVRFRVQRGVTSEADIVTVEKIGHRDRF